MQILLDACGGNNRHRLRSTTNVRTDGSAVAARSAEGQVSVSTDGSVVGAKSVEEPASVSTAGSLSDARGHGAECCRAHCDPLYLGYMAYP